jgi:hypothetical protein
MVKTDPVPEHAMNCAAMDDGGIKETIRIGGGEKTTNKELVEY